MDLVLLSAGVGKRSGLSYPKQFFKINGKPIIVYSLEVFSKLNFIDQVIVTCNVDYIEETREIIANYGFSNVVFVAGGAERQDSVRNALNYVKTESVIIHEAARPFISEDFLKSLHEKYDEKSAIVPVINIPFTVALGNDNEMTGILNRKEVKNIQLPQIFPTMKLRQSHLEAEKDGFQATEDSMLFYKYGGDVNFVDGRVANIKITNELDIFIANKLMEMNDE